MAPEPGGGAIIGHTRKTSLPSASHPLVVSAEQHLHSLVISKSSSSSPSLLCQQLKGLKTLYESLDDALHLPLTISRQQHLWSNQQEKLDSKWTSSSEDVLDQSIKLLDVCGAVRDCFSLMNEGVKELESSLRRRRASAEKSGLEAEVGAYMASKKTLRKMVNKCLRDMKRAAEKHYHCCPTDGDSDDELQESLFTLLKRVQQISFSVLESSLKFTLTQAKASRSSNPILRSGWSILSKILQAKKKVSPSSEGGGGCQTMEVSPVEKVEAELLQLARKKSNPVEMHHQEMLKKWKGIESSIEELEKALEGVYRQLLKTRVTLLNIVNH